MDQVNNNSIWHDRKFRFLILGLVIIVPFEILSFFSLRLPVLIEAGLCGVIILLFGRQVLIRGIKSLAQLSFSDINLLMVIAMVGAFYLKEFPEAAIVIVLFSLGEVLEDYGMDKSRSALEELVNKTPKTVLIKGTDTPIAIEAVTEGMIIVVKPGDTIALDGIVAGGQSPVDESAITGEPLPKTKIKNDTLYAGSINGHGYLEVSVTKTAKDTTLSKIISLTYASQKEKSQSQQFIEKFAQYYTPAILIASILLVVVPVLGFHQSLNVWLIQALTLLLISCPCALVISTPVSVFSAIGNASKKGMLIKGGKYLEEVGRIKGIALDKTRTLTEGIPYVSDVVPYNGTSREDLLACIAGAESLSEHPLAKSITNLSKQEKLDIHGFVNFKAIMGKGIQGDCTVCIDKHHCIGTLKFVSEEHAVTEDVVKQVEAFEAQGKTAIVVADNEKISGVLGITDTLRPESIQLIRTLKEMHIEPVMLTGDNSKAAHFIASQVGIKTIYGELLPQDKLEKIKELTRKYHSVAMVGDGVNDAPALAAATVGIAMGAVGSDLAIENANIALMNTNLLSIPYLILLGKKTGNTIRFNTALAIVIKIIFVAIALSGYGNLVLAILADVGVTVFVILNSLTLYNYKASDI